MRSPRNLPGLTFLYETYIQPLARGEFSVAQVRSQLVRRSAVLFADRLPGVQVHHATADDIVDVSQVKSLIDALIALGGASRTSSGTSTTAGPTIRAA